MKAIAFLSGFMGSLLILGITLPAPAQISSDNTTNTTVNLNGNNFDILNGIQKGNNLFHSFKEFSIPKGGEATFNNSTDVVNIINRVTGGNISNIDGLIKANGSANLFLINPAGIVFGENANLNIGGSFFGSTAESIFFEDGFEFSAVNSQNKPLLTVSVPLGLQMGTNPSPIELQKSNLSVSFNKTLALIGGNVVINGGSLTASGGKVELGGLSNIGTVDIDDSIESINFPEEISRANVSLNNAAVVDVSSVSGGSIAVNAADFQMSEASKLQAGLIAGTGIADLDKDIIVNATGNINLLDRSLIANNVQTDAIGNGGKIELTANSLSLIGGSRIQTKTDAAGSSGDININVNNATNIIGHADERFFSGILTIPAGEAAGDGGNISIQTNNLLLTESGRISIETKGAGDSGNFFVKATGNIDIIGTNAVGLVSRFDAEVDKKATGNGGNVTIETNNLRIADGGRISLETEGKGNAGNLNVKATGNIDIIGSSFEGFVSRIVAEVDAPATGKGGNILLQSNNLRLIDGGRISVETEGAGNAGKMQIRAKDSIEINGADSVQGYVSRLEAEVDELATGNGGNILVETGSLKLIDAGLISVDTDGKGNGGVANIKAQEIELIGISADALNPTRITAASSTDAAAGELNITTDKLNIRDRAEITVSSLGSGDAGNVNIDAGSIFLDNQASIRAEVQNGDRGNINLQVRDAITASNNSQIIADITGNASGGSIDIAADKLDFSTGSFFSTNTNSTGNAGSINLTGNNLSFDGKSTGVFSEAVANSSGNAGNINLTAQKLQITNNAKISTNSAGLGKAGNINITSNTINANRGSITATSLQTGGGNLFFNLDNLILRNNSVISSSVLDSTGGGGNITIQSPVIAGFENSDIIANAFEGNGGNIDITTQGIFGLEFRDELTEESDISASSKFGINGTVDIKNFGIDPGSGLVELNLELADSSQKIATGCSNNTGNSFVATGRGGIAKNPNEQVDINKTWSDIRDLSAYRKLNNNIQTTQISDKPAIVEATGFIRNEKGEIELVAAQNMPFKTQVLDCSGINT
jgi:filamentous hemagglutinin family protein